MIRFLARRFLNYLVLLVLASFLTFCLASVTFHPLDSYIQRHPTPTKELINAKAAQLGLDKPIPIRYAKWVSGVTHGDFGTTVSGHPVSRELWHRIWISLRLVVTGSVLGTIIGVIVGAWGAIRQYRLSDRVITVLALMTLSIPSFVLASMLILVALRINMFTGVRIFLYTGETSPIPPGGVWDRLIDRVQHLILPTLTLALGAIASFSRYQRNAMLDVLGEDFIRTARAKGLTRRRALFKHGLRTALDSARHPVRVRTQRAGRRRDIRREDLRLARHGRMGGVGHLDTGHQRGRGHHAVYRIGDSARRPVVRCLLCGARSEGAGDMSTQANPVTEPARSSVDPGAFTSRRNLVIRRFIRNRPAVAALALLVLAFVGCYALPPLLPYDYNHLDYGALLQPPSLEHWFGTNALGQDLLARTLRGMQKSMLIGVCVALISTSIAATVGSVAGYFGGWRDRALMWLVDLLLVVPGFLLIVIVTPRTKGSATFCGSSCCSRHSAGWSAPGWCAA